jgi:hypothetical protein
MKSKTIKIVLLVFVAVYATSCAKKLDLFPVNDLTPEKTFSTAAGYKSTGKNIWGVIYYW